MTIDEAISLLPGIEDCDSLKYLPEHRAAVKLGIEALKQLKREREKSVGFWADRLLGETEE